MTTQTDNDNLPAKLALRRHFLDRYGAASVFDACQGSGVLWKILRTEYQVERYWGVDKKEARGRLTIDSARVLESPGWTFDVVDVDTYDEPWAHWFHVLENGRADVTVFLTIGLVRMGGGQLSGRALDQLGIPFDIPPGLKGQLSPLAVEACLASALLHGWEVAETQEAPRGRSARYLGLRLVKPAPKHDKGKS